VLKSAEPEGEKAGGDSPVRMSENATGIMLEKSWKVPTNRWPSSDNKVVDCPIVPNAVRYKISNIQEGVGEGKSHLES